jgi:two-component system, NtrC family, response regulator AtoC
MTGRTVLIVDDEELLRWSLRERFLQDGYTVLESGTAAAAIAEFRRGDVDVVLLDCRLPDSDGILMTAFPTIENAGDAATYGASDYLVKPFDLDDVVGAVEKKRNRGRP